MPEDFSPDGGGLSPTKLDKSNTLRSTLHVFLPNGDFRAVKFGENSDLKSIVEIVIRRLGANISNSLRYYGLKYESATTGEYFWLNHNLTMSEIKLKFQKDESWRFKLLIRFLPAVYKDLYHIDKTTFYFLYDQVRTDYMKNIAEEVDIDVAFQLGVLEMKRFFNNMPQVALDKKSNLDFIEKEFGLQRFLPLSIVDHMKNKDIRHRIQKLFKQCADYKEDICCFQFYDLLLKEHRYDLEVYKCTLGNAWSIPVDVVVGPNDGISYRPENGSKINHMADIKQINSIYTSKLKQAPGKATLNIQVEGREEALVFTFDSVIKAGELADLIDGYYGIMNSALPRSLIVKRAELCKGKPKPEYAGKDKKTFFGANMERADHIEKVQWLLLDVGDKKVSMHYESLSNRIKLYTS